MATKSTADRFDVAVYDACEGWVEQATSVTREEAWVLACGSVRRSEPVVVCRPGLGFRGVVWSCGSSHDVDNAYRADEMRAQERAAGVR